MTVTTTETLSVDGVVLNTLAYNIESTTGRLKTPPIRGDNVQVPSRHGSIFSSTKMYDEGSIVLPMWVRGCNPNGSIPYTSSEREEFFKNIDMLTSLFSSKRRLLDLRHKLPDGSVRQAMVEVRDVIDFSNESYSPMGKFSVILNMPEAFWKDVADVTSTNTIAVSGANLELDEFIGATAPMEDLSFTITGPVTNFKMSATENGVAISPELSFQYAGAIAATKSLTVNCATWALTAVGFSPVYSNVTHKGSARYMVVMPDALPRIKVEGTALTGASAVSVTGRRKFLIG
jgi:Phage tail protein